MSRPRVTAWQAARRQRQLEVGAVIVAERQRGRRWTDLAEAFGLADESTARSLACRYLIALAAPRQAAQEAARETQPRPVRSPVRPLVCRTGHP